MEIAGQTMLWIIILLLATVVTATRWTEHTVNYNQDGEPIIESHTNAFDCSLHCKNGQLTLTSNGICGCKCTGQFSGKLCDTCSLTHEDCVFGTLDATSCTCSNCQAPWTGPLCKTCGLTKSDSCQSVDRETCRCSESSNPGHAQCKYQTSDCQHGGRLSTDKECCQCDNCDKFWGGPLCNTCVRPKESSCLNGGVLDIE